MKLCKSTCLGWEDELLELSKWLVFGVKWHQDHQYWLTFDSTVFKGMSFSNIDLLDNLHGCSHKHNWGMAMGSPKPHKFLTAASTTTVVKVDY